MNVGFSTDTGAYHYADLLKNLQHIFRTPQKRSVRQRRVI